MAHAMLRAAPVAARVTGFDYTTYHAYTTEVSVDGRRWSLALRYNTFFRFYERLLVAEPQFKAPFPPKGGLFFSPQPEERQAQLDDFVQNALTFFDLRGRPERMAALLDDLLQVSDHLDAPEDGDEDEDEGLPAKVEEEKKKKEEDAPLGGLLNSKWAKALVSAAMQVVVANTFQEAADAGKAETPKPAKSVDAGEMDTPTTPTSRASLTATVTPLGAFEAKVEAPVEAKVEAPVEPKSEAEGPVKTEAKTEAKPRVHTQPKSEDAPVVVVNAAASGVRSRIAVWERRASSPTVPSPRGAGRRSSSCSSAGELAPVVPLGVSDVSKPAVETPKTQSKPVVAATEVVTEKEAVKEKEVVKEKEAVKEKETVTEKKETVTEKKETATEKETVTETVKTPSVKTETMVEQPKVVSKEDATTVEQSKVVSKEDATPTEQPKVEQAPVAAAETEAPKTASDKAESDAYDSDASDEIRRLGLEKLDVNERLRRYRHPVFFQGFYCRVRASSIAGEAGRA